MLLNPGLTIATFQRNISQHFERSKRLATLLRRVTTCISNCWLKFEKRQIFMRHLWMLHHVVVVWPRSCNNVAHGHVHLLDFQHPTCSNSRDRVTKRIQPGAPKIVAIVWSDLSNVGPTVLEYVAIAFTGAFNIRLLEFSAAPTGRELLRSRSCGNS